MVYKTKEPLLQWGYRQSPEETRRHCEAEILRSTLQINKLRGAREPLLGPQKGDPQPMLDKIDERLKNAQERLLRHARELFVLDHPDRRVEYGPHGWAVLSDDDEMFIRMKYL